MNHWGTRIIQSIKNFGQKPYKSRTIITILSINLTIVIVGFFSVFIYYEPGNPNRWLCCRNPWIETLGIIGFFIGIFQLLYLLPVIFYAVGFKKWKFLKEILAAILITIFLNLLFLWILVKSQ